MKKIIYIIAIALLFAACDKPKDKWTDSPSSGFIRIAVDESFQPIIDTEIQVFESIYLGAGIMPLYTTEKNAVDLMLEDSVRLCIMARQLTKAEKKKFADKKFFPREHLIATDAVALIVHKTNPDSILSVKNIQQILTGKISEWKELNPQTPLNGEINMVFDHNDSGCLRYMIDSVAQGTALTGNLFAQKSNQEVIEYVAKSPNALGLIGVNWIENPIDSTNLSFNEQVSVVAISKLEFASYENSFQPYQAYIATGDYPFTRGVYAVLSDPRSGLSSSFATFLCHQKGQTVILKSGLVPATQNIRIIQTTKEF